MPSVVLAAESMREGEEGKLASNGHGESPSILRHSHSLKHTDSFSITEASVEVGEDGSVMAGTPSALLQQLLPPSPHAASQTYAFTLLLNIRTSMAPIDVLTAIFRQTMFSQNSAARNFSRENRTRMFAAVFNVCSVWVHHIPFDFTHPNMTRRLEELLQLCAVDEHDRVKSSILMDTLKSSLNRLSRYERALANLVVKEEQELVPSETISGLFAVSSQPLVIAQQLTHIELERLSMVGLEEIMSALSEAKDLSSLGLSGASRGVASAIAWFNRLSQLTATEVMHHSRKRVRVAVVELWVDVAKQCFDMGNFNSTCAIVAGLNSPPVTRLKKTWSRVDTAKLNILQHQLDPSGNFLSYRSTMKAAVWRAEGGSTDEEKIIVPFFVLLLKDLYLLYHSAPRELPDGQLNFEAWRVVAAALWPLSEWKKRVCSAGRNAQLLQYLLVAPTHPDSELLLRSFEYEDADSSIEKELAKKLKGKV